VDGYTVNKWLFLYIILACVPACTKRSSIQKQYHTDEQINVQQKYDIDFVRQQEARLIDIPIPLHAKPEPKYCWIDEAESASVMLSYTFVTSPHDIASFYIKEMERSGWDQIMCLDACEYMLIFEKPGRVCSISLRPVNSLPENNLLIICTGNTCSSVEIG
jgi:hypothetical protein